MQRALALVPFVIGLCAAAAGAAATWALLSRGLWYWESGAFTGGPEFVVVMLVSVVLGALATVLSWRRIVGPPIERIEWTLVFPALEQGEPGDHSPRAWTVADLRAPLATLGYSLEAAQLDDAGNTPRPAADPHPIAGAPLELVRKGVARRHGRVVLRIPPARAPGAMALGFVDSYGALDGPYDELGRHVIAALGTLYPELTYKRLDSGLSEESAATLWSELPDRGSEATNWR